MNIKKKAFLLRWGVERLIREWEPDKPTLHECGDPWPYDGFHAEDAYREGNQDGFTEAARALRELLENIVTDEEWKVDPENQPHQGDDSR